MIYSAVCALTTLAFLLGTAWLAVVKATSG